MKRIAIVLTLMVGIALGTGATAFAGEVNGKGEPIPAPTHASSECVYSGRDLPDEIENNPPGFDDDAIAIHGAQTYGQFVAADLKSEVPSPGVACRGNG